MSEFHDTEAPLLPDDAEQKINELLEALHASGEQMMEGSAAVHDDTPELALNATGSAESGAADFPGAEAGDFVDLEAEQLDNSADVLRLDETDPYEEPQQQALDEPQELHDLPEPELLMAGPQDSTDHEGPLNAEEAQQRLDDEALGELFRAPEPAPPRVSAPHRPADTVPFWLSPGSLALLLSAAALWFSLSVPTPAAVPELASGERIALEDLKVDLAALRERLNAVEKRAAAGEESVTLLEQMQAGLSRMEQQLLARGPAVASSPAQVAAAATLPEGTAPVVHSVSVASQQVAPATMETAEPADEAVVVSAVKDDEMMDKTFIKGWAVNLRSYYHQLDAERLVRSYREAGIAAEIRGIRKGVALWYRVRVKGFTSKKEANAFIAQLADKQDREMAWPSYYEGYVKG